MRRLALLLLLVPVSASAAERRYPVPPFERIRVQGPFDVTVAAGRKTEVVVEGAGDLDAIDVRAEGSTLTLGGLAGPTSAPLHIRVTAAGLTAASVSARGRLAIDTMQGDRIDLAVNGIGSIQITGIHAGELHVTAAGQGTIAIAGDAHLVSMRVLGTFGIDGAALTADELSLYSGNDGDAKLNVRSQASITNVGPGTVRIAGRATCTIRGKAPVDCAGR
jgi:hypothetical protein